MKIVNFIFNILVLLLVLLLANHFFRFIAVPGWITAIVMAIVAILFFIRAYVRYGRR